ncbi:Protein pleiotropic regulatory locus 1, partial [Linum grandiflorum]
QVISGHLGWVRSIAFDPSNTWFCTGSADRLAVSQRHTYMFSAGDDKLVKCWDLEQNKAIRSYHGHLSGVYCLALHPTIDLLLTGGRDSVCRVWDIRTKMQAFALAGHDNTVWHSFASASADNIKKFNLPKGEFMHNMLSQQKTIINTMAVNEDGVMVTGGDNGSLWFWDWKSGHNFQQSQTIVQPEAGIFAACFDLTGSRLITCEADKTIKMWKEDENATPESHPVNFKPPKDIRRF